MNKKTLGIVGALIAIVGLVLWLVLESVQMAVVYDGEKAAEVFTGLDFLKGIEDGGVKITILSFMSAAALVFGIIGALTALGGNKKSGGLVIASAICLFLSVLVVPFLGYTSDGKLMADFVKLTGAQLKWGVASQGYIALVVIFVGGIFCLSGNKEK